MTLTAGFGGVSRHACAALVNEETVLGVCEQERITRVRGAGVEASGLPDQALDALLAHAHSSRSAITRGGTAEEVARGHPMADDHVRSPRGPRVRELPDVAVFVGHDRDLRPRATRRERLVGPGPRRAANRLAVVGPRASRICTRNARRCSASIRDREIRDSRRSRA